MSAHVCPFLSTRLVTPSPLHPLRVDIPTQHDSSPFNSTILSSSPPAPYDWSALPRSTHIVPTPHLFSCPIPSYRRNTSDHSSPSLLDSSSLVVSTQIDSSSHPSPPTSDISGLRTSPQFDSSQQFRSHPTLPIRLIRPVRHAPCDHPTHPYSLRLFPSEVPVTPTPALVRIRDYAAEMRDIIDQRTQAVSYNAAEVADEIVQHLLHEDRELLYGWLEGHAAQTIRTAIAQRDASTRAYARTHAPKAAFAEAANAAKGGDPQPLRLGFLQAVYVCAADNTRKALKDMTAADVLYVADSYEGRAKQALLEAAFLRAVAKKIGAGRVADVFNNQQLAELRTKLGAD